MIDDDRWPETESGTVVRHYFHTRGANREMQVAQKEGWNIQEVKLNGAVATEERRGLLRRSPLVRERDGTLRIRASSAAGWGHPSARGQELIEVTYQR